ncbi:MAG: YIP1 family protein [Deltaproteobacteria bacterium]|nr:YIP1 family protein [Deltaproteobacteria bacterium]MBW2351811.1 YIP1 family protein [Deltaproteobacteria bacterium]
MNTEISCPFCHFSKKIPEKKIPASARWAVCPRCNQKFEIVPSARVTRYPDKQAVPGWNLHGSGQDNTEETLVGGTPWENRAETGLVKGIWRTFRDALFSPSRFFREQSTEEGIREPFAFGLLAGAVGHMLGIFWPVLMMSAGIFPFGDTLFGHLSAGLIFLVMLVAVPVSVTLTMFLYSGVLHLLLLITRGGDKRFQGTFRVVAYSQAAQAWDLVPVVGGWIGSIWQVVIQVIGLREVHRTSYLRVLTAFLLPMGLFFLVTVIALVYLFA